MKSEFIFQFITVRGSLMPVTVNWTSAR